MSKRTGVDDQFRHTRGGLAELLNQAKGLQPWLDQHEAEAMQPLAALGADTQTPKSDPKDPTLARLACDLRAVLFRVRQVRLFGITEAGMLEMERLGYACAVAKMRLSEPAIATGAKVRAGTSTSRQEYAASRKMEHADWQEAINQLYREREGTSRPRGHVALCKALAERVGVHADTIRRQTANPKNL